MRSNVVLHGYGTGLTAKTSKVMKHVGLKAKDNTGVAASLPALGMIAAIRVRGTANIEPSIRKTLETLRLMRPNHLVLLPEDKGATMMVQRAKDYVTFGEVDEKTLATLLEKRAEMENGTKVTQEALKEKKVTGFEELARQLMNGKTKLRELGIRNVFRLHPPRKGHKRKGIKAPYSMGGALGKRGEKINELIMRMV